MISVVTWLWRTPWYRSQFSWEHVEALARQVRRHYPHPHKFLCISNVPGGAAGVERVHDTEDFAYLESPHGARHPSCYRRLRMFQPFIGSILGERFVSLDVDSLIVGDPTPLWHREEDIVLWRDPGRGRFCGSMVLLRAGTRAFVWESFRGMTSAQQAFLSGTVGSDQGWMSYTLAREEATWTKADGVYSYRYDIQPHFNVLPADARIVFFHGPNVDPWLPHMQKIPWIQEAYGESTEPLANQSATATPSEV